jgi:endonuclease/exonuclease/phosphatase family metal-dependent hydrolase
MWKLLRGIKPCSQAPWLMIGDFNEAMWSFEHFSSRRRPDRQMLDFQEVLSHCDLYDLGFSGLPWTFDNKQIGTRNVKVRLDHAVASLSWSHWFPDARLQHLVMPRSDHCPVFLEVEKDLSLCSPNQIMRYEIMWEREESLFRERLKLHGKTMNRYNP